MLGRWLNYMEQLRDEIASSFGLGDPPRSNEIVQWDGYDQLEKSDAVEFYAGRSWSDVFSHLHGLRDRRVFTAAYYLEEWSVLSKLALTYYLRAHLEYLLDYDQTADDEFVCKLLGQLYQVIFMHRGSPFADSQTLVLKKLALDIAKAAKDQDRFDEIYRSDIHSLAMQFLHELEAHA